MSFIRRSRTPEPVRVAELREVVKGLKHTVEVLQEYIANWSQMFYDERQDHVQTQRRITELEGQLEAAEWERVRTCEEYDDLLAELTAEQDAPATCIGRVCIEVEPLVADQPVPYLPVASESYVNPSPTIESQGGEVARWFIDNWYNRKYKPVGTW